MMRHNALQRNAVRGWQILQSVQTLFRSILKLILNRPLKTLMNTMHWLLLRQSLDAAQSCYLSAVISETLTKEQEHTLWEFRLLKRALKLRPLNIT